MRKTREELSKMKYLTPSDVDEILDGFKKLGLDEFNIYSGINEFTQRIDKVSTLRSEGIEYTVNTSTS